jgi:sRNA-binding regulator protein Hfq
MSESLVGKKITIHIVGGLSMCGEVISQDKESIFLEIDSEVYMVFKSKVCYVKLGEEKNVEEKKNDDYKENADEVFPQNGMSYSESYGSLPIGMLDVDVEDDFSVFFGGTTSKKVSFSNEGEKHEKARENNPRREE